MKVSEVLNSAKNTVTVKQVFAEPYEQDGVTIIPAAVVSGGLGGGSGHDDKGQEGEGGGFGISARPAGAYVIRNGQIDWRPAVDPNRMVTMVGLVVIAYLLSRPRMARARSAAVKG